MNRILRVFALGFAVIIGCAGSAAAYCPQPTLFGSATLADQINSQLDWMLCLHNEQVGSLNRHSERMSALVGLIRMEGDRVDAIVLRERDNFAEREIFLQRIIDLEQRIETLERLLTESQ